LLSIYLFFYQSTNCAITAFQRVPPACSGAVVAAGGRRPTKMASTPNAEKEANPLEEFKALVRSAGSKSKPALPSKFIKKMEEIPSLELSPEEPCNVALFLAENGLIGKAQPQNGGGMDY
jgi:hypothetical protein